MQQQISDSELDKRSNEYAALVREKDYLATQTDFDTIQKFWREKHE